MAYGLVVFNEAHKLSANREPDFRVRKTDRYRLAEALAGAGVDGVVVIWSGATVDSVTSMRNIQMVTVRSQDIRPLQVRSRFLSHPRLGFEKVNSFRPVSH